MDRRTFLSAAAAIAFLPLSAQANETVDYTPGVIEQALGQGKTVFVDYAAVWCPTCKAQERVVEQLRSENPDYNANIVFVRVDWDDFKREAVTTSRKIPRRSTLVLLKGDQELGRIVAGTRRADIQALLDKGLSPQS